MHQGLGPRLSKIEVQLTGALERIAALEKRLASQAGEWLAESKPAALEPDRITPAGGTPFMGTTLANGVGGEGYAPGRNPFTGESYTPPSVGLHESREVVETEAPNVRTLNPVGESLDDESDDDGDDFIDEVEDANAPEASKIIEGATTKPVQKKKKKKR